MVNVVTFQTFLCKWSFVNKNDPHENRIKFLVHQSPEQRWNTLRYDLPTRNSSLEMLPFYQSIRSYAIVSSQYFKESKSWFHLAPTNNHSHDFTNNKHMKISTNIMQCEFLLDHVKSVLFLLKQMCDRSLPSKRTISRNVFHCLFGWKLSENTSFIDHCAWFPRTINSYWHVLYML